MKILYLTKSGQIEHIEISDQSFPLSCAHLKKLCPSFLEDYSVFINESRFVSSEDLLNKTDRIWFVPKAHFDIKAWRAEQALK